MAARFEVQPLMGNNWDNCWQENEQPLTFTTREEAEGAIAAHIDDVKQAVSRGDMAEGSEADAVGELRVRECATD